MQISLSRTAGVATGAAAIAIAGLVAPTATAAVDHDAVTLADYQENKKALIGKFDTGPIPGYPQGVSVIYEVAVDQLTYRNGNSHKAWFIPESSKGLIVYVKDLATNQGITNSAPNIKITGLPFQGGGSFSFDDADVRLMTGEWRVGSGPNRVTGTFDMQWKRGGPGAKAINNTGGDFPRAIGSKELTGSFTHNGVEYVATVEADVVDFRNGTSHKELVIPESHKIVVTDAAGNPFPGRIHTPFQAPGVETFDANTNKNPLDATATTGNGNHRVTTDFDLS